MHTTLDNVTELRQYTLRPGARGTLIELFERELIEPQERAGMDVGGLFLDRDDPDRFVWFRGFASMAARRESLETFYSGPSWAAHGPAANATMLDSDDVLLLRATDPPHPPPPAGDRAPVGARDGGSQCVAVAVHRHQPDDALAGWLARDVHSALQRVLGVPVCTRRTEPAVNDWPRLPVRPDTVFVWSAVFPSIHAHDDAVRRLGTDPFWQESVEPRLRLQAPALQHLRLKPTPRSRHTA
jgi:hypothetical protein